MRRRWRRLDAASWAAPSGSAREQFSAWGMFGSLTIARTKHNLHNENK
ncbi:MAG: hypothetical protein JRI57_07505 [Deltaproteobacteria bacterium]|nr:hypothetical protein [Deltaproteobacteria bacterium]MBW1952297.1 hypothetical protein [Deltaproteobacteria bacterium]MBW1986007.1 hypothetical protein [Deltaproteobacteria bacterium]MBW2134831.1 hypothetical protein [Deltaproteobacteria bacterium]